MLSPLSSRQSADFSLREYELEDIGASRFASVAPNNAFQTCMAGKATLSKKYCHGNLF